MKAVTTLSSVVMFPEGGKELKGTVCFKCKESVLKAYRDCLSESPLRDNIDRALRVPNNGVCVISAEDALAMGYSQVRGHTNIMEDLIIYDQTG